MHVMIALDLSESSPATLEGGLALAIGLSAEVTLIHVGAPEPGFVGYDVGPATVRQAVANDLRREHRELDVFRQQVEQRGLIARALMVQGATVERLLQQVARLMPDYLVVGTSGHSLLHDVVVGSVTRDLLRSVSIPVLVVPTGAPHEAVAP